MMEMYRTRKINPLGGCLPMLVQMPVFIALYNVLANSVELRKEPFVLWINDLSSPDLIGTVMGLPIHILPLLMAATMVIQQRLQPMDPRQAVIGYLMPIMMLVFFYMLPSGLVFYWTINNVLQVGQQIIINRESGQQLAAA
jgi:YidC/Oxa1 family membrane protein insertase